MARGGDTPTVLCECRPGRLVPVTSLDAEILDRYPSGTQVEISIREPRSSSQMRLFWLIMGKIRPHTPYISTEALVTACKLRLGWFDEMQLIGGGAHLIPRSLREMDRPLFSEFFEACLYLISTEIVPGLDTSLFMERAA